MKKEFSFENPNYEALIGDKYYHVENDLVTLSNDKSFIQGQYHGYKYGNQVIKVGYYEEKIFNEFRWNLKEMLSFLNNPVFPYTQKITGANFATLNIEENSEGVTVQIIKKKAVSFFLKNEQWDYFVMMLKLSVKKYFYAKRHLKTLNDEDKNLIKSLFPELDKNFAVEDMIKKFGKTKPIFRNKEETLTYDIAGYGIKKSIFKFGDVSNYLDIQYSLLIAQDIKSEKYFKMFGRTKKALFTRDGGTIAARAGREDNNPTARRFTILNGEDADTIIFKLEVGLGELTETSGITMKKVEETYIAKVEKEEALSLADGIEVSIFSYLVNEYYLDNSRPYNERKLQQPIKVEARKSLVEIKTDAFNMNKIRFNFSERNPNTNKQVKFVDFYMTEEQLFEMNKVVFDGSLYKKVVAEKNRIEALSKKTGKREWAKAVLVLSAGTSSKRSGKDPVAKTFNITPPISKTAHFNITGTSGIGKETDKGLIQMAKPQLTVPVPVTADNMKMIILSGTIYWKAYKVAQNMYLEEKQSKEV